MKDTELLEHKIRMQNCEISSLNGSIKRLERELDKFETVLRDLLIHMELEFYTEKVDGWIYGHGIRKRTEEQND